MGPGRPRAFPQGGVTGAAGCQVPGAGCWVLNRTIEIEADRAIRAFDTSELWRYRELLYFLVWRDVKVRYKQTVIGMAWAIVRPFITMVIFTIVFGRLAGLPSDSGAPYPVADMGLRSRCFQSRFYLGGIHPRVGLSSEQPAGESAGRASNRR